MLDLAVSKGVSYIRMKQALQILRIGEIHRERYKNSGFGTKINVLIVFKRGGCIIVK